MRYLSMFFVVFLAACAQPMPMMDEPTAAPLPEGSYIAAAKDGREVYRVLTQESLILVRVGRAGRMQRFGHEHAVASEDVHGFVEIAADPASSRADLAFPLQNLVVDKIEYRQKLQLDSKPSADDVAGTYANMLKVLEPSLYPWVNIHAGIVTPPLEQTQLSVSVELHGHAFELWVPVDLDIRDGRLIVSGEAVIRHSDFGLEPFSAVGGLVRVADELLVEFRIVGERMTRSEEASSGQAGQGERPVLLVS